MSNFINFIFSSHPIRMLIYYIEYISLSDDDKPCTNIEKNSFYFIVSMHNECIAHAFILWFKSDMFIFIALHVRITEHMYFAFFSSPFFHNHLRFLWIRLTQKKANMNLLRSEERMRNISFISINGVCNRFRLFILHLCEVFFGNKHKHKLLT